MFKLHRHKEEKLVMDPYFITARDNPYFDENFVENKEANLEHLKGFWSCGMDFHFAYLNNAFLTMAQGAREINRNTNEHSIRVGWKDNLKGLRAFLKDLDYTCDLFFMHDNVIKG